MAKTTSVPKRKVSSAGSKALRRPKKVSLARRKAAVRKPAVKKTVPARKLVIKKTAPVQKKTVRPQPTPRRGSVQAQNVEAVRCYYASVVCNESR